jgi:LPS export ABC transporter protein LptC
METSKTMYYLRRIIWIWLAPAALMFGCENNPADVAALLARLDPQVEEAREVEILYSDSAQVKVRITGPMMLNHADPVKPRQEFTNGILVEFFGPNRQISSRLTARYALRVERDGEVLARDSVVWLTENNEKLETEELIWDEKRKEVYTRKFAVITTPKEIIYGHGFTANQDFSEARIQQVEGIITVDEPRDSTRSDSGQ